MIYYLMGKSASGKDTIYRHLKKRCPTWREVVLYTTRPIRDGEKDGETYHFIDDARMDCLEHAGKVIEERVYHTVYGPWRYATVDDGQIQDPESMEYLMIGTLESYCKMREYFGRSTLFPLYIEVPNELRLKRAEERELSQQVPKLKEMHRRFQADEIDFSEDRLRQAGIIKRYQNINLEQYIYEILKDSGKPDL